MHSHCPTCGIKFERETGYFLNAMFVGYAAGFLALLPTAVWLAWQNVSIAAFSVAMIAQTALLTPLIFRYARLLWMHTDQLLDPRPLPSAANLNFSQSDLTN
jgi:hypothetical protein